MVRNDRFGNALDPDVGFARGTILRSSADEVRRLREAQRVAAAVIAARGSDAIGIFTGNPRFFPLHADDLDVWCEEWIGPGIFAERLARVAIEHLGGDGSESVAVVNRTTAGIVAAVLALAANRPVVSVVPAGDRSHASVTRGCALAGVELIEVEDVSDAPSVFATHRPALAVVTTVTSSLARMSDPDTQAAVAAARAVGATVLMDEAYGARLRPVLHGGTKSLAFGPDLAITNSDKAGLSGPRAGILAGRAEPLVAVLAQAAELGMEARAPIAAGALRSLEAFDPALLVAEAADGRELADALVEHVGEDVVVRTDLGPSIGEEDVLALLLDRADGAASSLVPCEATAAVGMLLLRDHGILTVNTHGQPGGRVSLRLKPTAGAVARVGGAQAVAAALGGALDVVASHIDDRDWTARLVLGDA